MKRAALASGCAGGWTALGATCYVIAPRKLDEQGKRVKTDALDAGALCQRLSRYVDGNTQGTGRDPRAHRGGGTAAAHPPAARSPGAGADQAPGPGPQPAGQPRPAGAAALVAPGKAGARSESVLPGWLLERLAVYRPLLAVLDTQIAALTAELEKAAPAEPARRPGQADQRRRHPRSLRLAPLQEPAAGQQLHRPLSRRILQRRQTRARRRDQARQPAPARRAGRTGLAAGPLPARLSTGPQTARRSWPKAPKPPARRARKPSSPWPGNSPSISGAGRPASAPPRNSA